MNRIFTFLFVLTSVVSCGKTNGSDDPVTPVDPEKSDYSITDGKISEKVLNNYLSRAITEAEYLNSDGLNTDGYYGTDDDKRMLLNIGAKFVGRALYTWNGEAKFNNSKWLENAKNKIDAIHAVDKDVIFQAAIFETVSKAGVEKIKVPSWVFEAFEKKVENRYFKYDSMMDEKGMYKDQWGKDTCVPDMSREESQMWFYYVAVRYMETGIEALHMGQVNLMCSMGDSENNYAGWRKMQSLIRTAAKTKARRGIVLMDAHNDGIVIDGTHLFDFVSYPLRLSEITTSKILEAELKAGTLDSILGKTNGGKTPSGWYAAKIPYLLEFDNFGTSNHPGVANLNDHYVWGYDEISWLGLVSEDYAAKFVKACVDYLKDTDSAGHIQMPGCRVAAYTSKTSFNPYRCNTCSLNCTTGRNLENTIKAIWNSQE